MGASLADLVARAAAQGDIPGIPAADAAAAAARARYGYDHPDGGSTEELKVRRPAPPGSAPPAGPGRNRNGRASAIGGGRSAGRRGAAGPFKGLRR